MSPAPPDAAGPRRIVGRYRLEHELGRGAMGTVWSAYDEVLHRPVAVKEVRLSSVPVNERAIVRERTLREARATAMLSHPNVVTLYDVVEVASEPYVVMELLPSRSLASYIGERGRLTQPEAAEIGSAVASALTTAHRAGITHRDVKPGNVLIGENGQIKLTDFGIARNAAEQSMTQTGTVLGSPPYIAPEVAMGRAVGPAADLWGLGATLFACLEGRPPYDAGDPVGTVTEVVHGDVPVPAGRGPVVDVIRGLMVKDPAMRMPLAAVRRRLRPLLSDPEGPVLSTSSAPRTAAIRVPRPGPASDQAGLIPAPSPASSPSSSRGPTGTLADGDAAAPAAPAADQPGRPRPSPAPRTGPEVPAAEAPAKETEEAGAAPAEEDAGSPEVSVVAAPEKDDDASPAAGVAAAGAVAAAAAVAASDGDADEEPAAEDAQEAAEEPAGEADDKAGGAEDDEPEAAAEEEAGAEESAAGDEAEEKPATGESATADAEPAAEADEKTGDEAEDEAAEEPAGEPVAEAADEPAAASSEAVEKDDETADETADEKPDRAADAADEPDEPAGEKPDTEEKPDTGSNGNGNGNGHGPTAPKTPAPAARVPPPPSDAETTMVGPRVSTSEDVTRTVRRPPLPPRTGPAPAARWTPPGGAPAPGWRPAPPRPQTQGMNTPGPGQLASDPGPLPFTPTPKPPAPRRSPWTVAAVVALLVLMAAIGAVGAYALTRSLAGQGATTTMLTPSGPEVAGAVLIAHADTDERYSGTGLGFSALVPAGWQQFRLEQAGGDITVRFVSPDANRELRVDRVAGFYPSQRAADYLALLARPAGLGVDGSTVGPVENVGPAAPGAEPPQQVVYRTTSGPDDRTTWARLVPSGSDLWVVRLTAPSADPVGAPEQFRAVADSFAVPPPEAAPR
ncbi:serine/threonine-protein kinase [Actinomycetospora flava]|uniref:serine/threonine-protein kinase n=1 Tax=Actinomycetospora flava TaxID=3129232 RepID=UPI00359F3BA3